MKSFALTFLIFFSAMFVRAGVVVEQVEMPRDDDFWNGVGQSFTLPTGKTMSAIQLHI